MYLNVETREDIADEKQAYGAGLLEGYLTGRYIVEQYTEMYGNDICKSKPETCSWLKERIKSNKIWVAYKSNRKIPKDTLFYAAKNKRDQKFGGRARKNETWA